jgi:hypothetical protein
MVVAVLVCTALPRRCVIPLAHLRFLLVCSSLPHHPGHQKQQRRRLLFAARDSGGRIARARWGELSVDWVPAEDEEDDDWSAAGLELNLRAVLAVADEMALLAPLVPAPAPPAPLPPPLPPPLPLPLPPSAHPAQPGGTAAGVAVGHLSPSQLLQAFCAAAAAAGYSTGAGAGGGTNAPPTATATAATTTGGLPPVLPPALPPALSLPLGDSRALGLPGLLELIVLSAKLVCRRGCVLRRGEVG